MSKRQYYTDQSDEKWKDEYKTATRPKYTSASRRSSDYISRPTLSSSTDYISRPSQLRRSTTYRRKRGYASTSFDADYISRPLESRSDYISPRALDSKSSTSSRSISTSTSSSTCYDRTLENSPATTFSSPSSSTRRMAPTRAYSDSIAPRTSKVPTATTPLARKDSWAQKLDTMRSHGLKDDRYLHNGFQHGDQIEAFHRREDEHEEDRVEEGEDDAAASDIDRGSDYSYSYSYDDSDSEEKTGANKYDYDYDRASDIASYHSRSTTSGRSDRIRIPSASPFSSSSRSYSPARSERSDICAIPPRSSSSSHSDIQEITYASHDERIGSVSGEEGRRDARGSGYESSSNEEDESLLGDGCDYVSSDSDSDSCDGEGEGGSDVVSISDGDGGEGEGDRNGCDGSSEFGGGDDYMSDGYDVYDDDEMIEDDGDYY